VACSRVKFAFLIEKNHYSNAVYFKKIGSRNGGLAKYAIFLHLAKTHRPEEA